MNTNNTLPDNWECKHEYLNGNSKLVATYENSKTDEKVTVSPYKTYETAGFCNSHKVEYWGDSQTWETVSKGLNGCEYPEDAKSVAFDKIKEIAA